MRTFDLRFERYLMSAFHASSHIQLRQEFMNFKQRCLDSGLQFPPEAALYVCLDSDSMAVMGILHFIQQDGFISVDNILLDPVVAHYREAGLCYRIMKGLLRVLSKKRVTPQKPSGSFPVLLRENQQQVDVERWIAREVAAGCLAESTRKSGYFEYNRSQCLSAEFLNARFNQQQQFSSGEDFLGGRSAWVDPDCGEN